MKTVEIKIERNRDGTTNISSRANREVISKFVLPIISRNEGWGTREVTPENFWKRDQKEIQTILDATVGITDYARCIVAFLDEQPAGLIQGDFFTPSDQISSDHVYMKSLREIFSSPEFYLWRKLVVDKDIDNDSLVSNFQTTRKLVNTNNIIYSPGIVVRADLQGKKTGVTEHLYGYLKGISIAWTSNPIVVAKHRKIFSLINFYPLLGEVLKTSEEIAMAGCIMADLLNWSNDSWKDMSFGSAKSEYFVQERGGEYLHIAEEKEFQGQITSMDLKRLRWILFQSGVHGCLVSMI